MTSTTELDSLHSSLGEAEKYAKELERKLAEMEWRPIETAPKEVDWQKSPKILAFHARTQVVMIVNWLEHDLMWISRQGSNSGHYDNEFTHWMPLPEPPST